jgi:hypothetical protein
MNARTWNLKLMATDDHPETTLTGVSDDVARTVLHGLMYGYLDRARLHDAVAGARTDRHEGALAA